MMEKFILSIKTRFITLFLSVFLFISFDQAIKAIAQLYLTDGKSYSLFFNFISLQYIENPYGFLGVLIKVPENLRNLLLIFFVALLLVLAIVYVLFSKKMNRTKLVCTSLIISGGGSNLLDRLVQDIGVIDFMSFNLLFFSTGLCNFADLYIFAGSFGLGFLLTKDL